jgi:hypothetical protein
MISHGGILRLGENTFLQVADCELSAIPYCNRTSKWNWGNVGHISDMWGLEGLIV